METPSSSFNPLDSLKNAFSTTSSTLTDKVKENYNSLFNSGYIYFGLIAVVIVCVLLAYLLYYLITTRLFLQVKVVAEETKTPIVCTEKRKLKFTYDKTGNGERRTFTFWIYLHDMNKYKGMYKNVFNISESEEVVNINKPSPYIFLDKDNNRLYIRFSKKGTSDAVSVKYSSLDAGIADFMKQGIVVPYVPLQRWVHIAVVCNANSYKNYIYVYVDGDLVNSTSTGEIDSIIGGVKDLKDLNLNVQGFLNIGGSPNDFAEGPGFSGLVSKVTTYNYELNQKDIYDDYSGGPIGGILSRLGLSNYGVRSPIYKI
jgi:hypothetical protein